MNTTTESLKRIALALALCVAVQPAKAQEAKLPDNRNAALRYWMAFALMQDRPMDANTRKVLDRVVSGDAAWDEAALGPLVTANSEAIRTMVRAAQLPECNWGLEYELGPAAPVAHLAKARALARLAVLSGVRSLAQGRSGEATEVWLASLRFSRHLAENASLIGVLTARSALLATLRVVNKAAQSHSLDRVSLARAGREIRGLPEYGFDWSRAVRVEAWSGEIALRQLRGSLDPQALYRSWFGESAPPFRAIAGADIADYVALMRQAEAALALPYASSQGEVDRVIGLMARLHPVARQIIPSLKRINEFRGEVGSVRQEVLDKAK
jgi:hypothetical protein